MRFHEDVDNLTGSHVAILASIVLDNLYTDLYINNHI